MSGRAPASPLETAEIEKSIRNLKSQIEEARSTVAKLEGREQELNDRLSKEFGLKSLNAAVKEEERLDKQIGELDEKIKKKFSDLKEQYEW